MNITPCKPYHAVLDHFALLQAPDGRSAFKLYYLSVVGRPQRETYEWAFSAIQRPAFERRLIDSGLAGVGFITAFPHVTKIFRFSPYSETVLDVQVFNTADLTPRDTTRPDGVPEFGCYAEVLIAGEEYRAWAGAQTVEAYLQARCTLDDFPVAQHTKLAAYYG